MHKGKLTNVNPPRITTEPFIPMACVDGGFSGKHQFEERIWKEVKKGYCHFQNGDIGIAKISPCFENLKSTIFQNLPNNYGAGTTELVILRPLNIHAKFYLYLFKSQWYISEGTKYFKGVVGQQRVHKGIFTDLQIPLPPLAEQYRIVTEIERWFALIDQIEQGKADLQTAVKQTKSKILDLAIHGKLVPQDPNDEPAIELLKRINPDFTPCDNGHNEKLPSGWVMCKMKDCCKIVTGNTPSKSDKYFYGGSFPFYKPNDLDAGRHVTIASEYLTEKGRSKSRMIPVGTSAICCIGSIGKVGYIEKEGATNQQINCAIPHNCINTLFLYYLCISDYFGNKLRGSSSAVTISIVNKSNMERIVLPIPPLTEQQRIVQKIEELFSVLDDIQNALEV